MGLGPVSFQLAVSRIIRETLWRESLAGHLPYSLTFVSPPIPWVFTLGILASTLKKCWNVWRLAGNREKRAQKLFRRQRGCGFLWPLLSSGSLKSYV